MENEHYNHGLQYEVEDNLKKNIFYSLADGSIYQFAMGMVPIGTVLMYYMGNFTDSKILLGLLNTLYWFLFFTPQILIAKRVQAIRYYKHLSVMLGIGMRVFWLLLGVFTFVFAGSKPALYVLLFYILVTLIGMLSGFNNNVWLVYTARIIPSSKLSSYLSWRSTICGIFEIAGAYVSGIMLAYGTFPNNYGYLFIAVFVVSMVSMLFYNRTVEPRAVTKKTIQIDGKGYLKKLLCILKKDKNFQVYLISTAFIALGKMMFPFQIIYAKDRLSITAQDVALTSTVLFITQTIGYLFWGIIVKNKGLKLAGTLSGILFIPAVLLTMWMSNMWVLFLAVGFMSFAQSYRNSNENKLVINLSPNEEMLPSYIGLRNTILGPFFSMSSLIGGVILDISNFTVLSYISLFLIVIGMFLFAVKLKVPELE